MTALPDFVDVADIEDYRAGDDAAIVRQAQGVIRRYCGWHVAPEVTETLTLNGSGSGSLWLPSLYVTDIASITDCGDVVDADDYDWSTNGYVQRRSGCWTFRARQVVVELTHGYEDIPDELVEVAVSIASRAASSPSGAVQETTGPFSIRYASTANGVAGGVALLQHERDILDLFKLPPRP